MRLKYIILPLLIAICPGIFLFSRNIGESYLIDLLAVTLFAAVFTLVAFVCVDLVFKNHAKTSIFTALFVFCFFYTGLFLDNFGSFEIAGFRILRWRYALLLVTLLLLGVFIKFYKSDRKIFFYPNIIFPFAFLNAYLIIKIIPGVYQCNSLVNAYKRVNQEFLEDHFNVSKAENLEGLPNVYYIILDRYPSKKTLIERFNYDNTEFLESLSRKGFILPKASYSNYQDTLRSLSSSLNMQYHNLPLFKGRDLIFPALSDYMIRNNNVTKYFKLKGYGYIHAVSSWSHTTLEPNSLGFSTKTLVGSLHDLWKRSFAASPFVAEYLHGTMLGAFWERFFYEPKLREIIINQLKTLKDSVRVKSPNFIFAHIVCPHAPYLFDAEGNYVTLGYNNDKQYMDQITFINKEINKVIEYILTNSERKPVIILQSDHGMSMSDYDVVFSDAESNVKKIKQAFGILSAYYWPDGDRAKIYDHISPVNNFRVIFDHYFDSSFGLLEDKSYLGPMDDGSFHDVSKWVTRANDRA